jgi:3-deoxy-7-phosphoheptulonate synthase
MILVIRPDASLEQIQHVIDRVKELGFTAHESRGQTRTIIGVIGDETRPEAEQLLQIPGVEQTLPIMKPFKLASREFHKDDSAVYVGKVKIGGGSLAMIAGPCAVENYDVMDTVAKYVKAGGANILRGGAFKPRTSPYAFQGMGEDGLKILKDVGQKYDMPIVTEVMDPRQVELVVKYADMLQIGARNMQNFDLLKECGKTRTPVLLKRGMSATVKDLLMSAEYVLSEGNQGVVLCERGVRSFEDSTRNMLDMSAVPNVKGQSHLPIIVDPSHATGRPDLIPSMCRASVAAGADGVHVEVHNCPEKAMSDGPQALLPHQFLDLMGDLRKLAGALDRHFWTPSEN